MDAKARDRAARVSRDVLPGQAEMFHVEHPVPTRPRPRPSPAPPLPRELLVEMLGAVFVKVVRG
jgi:hypothetical protein